MKFFLTALLMFFVSSPALAQTDSRPASRPSSRPADVREAKRAEFRKLATHIMAYHERAFGICYGRPAPPIYFHLYTSLYLPSQRLAFYDETENFIALNAEYLTCDVSKLLANPAATETRTSGDADASDVRNVLSHELGHYFVDVLIETEIKDSWLQAHLREKRNLGDNDIGVFVIREGIGVYFENAFDRRAPDYGESGHTAKFALEELAYTSTQDWLYYTGGYWVVKPIIDTHGIEGIRYLLRTPLIIRFPGIEELSCYREEALRTLAAAAKR